MDPSSDPRDLIGRQLDKYNVIERVGHGGMAVVYRGLDRVLDREVAVKVLHAHLADSQESRLRLHREALTVARLRHPNIVEIYDYAPAEAGSSYIVTEFIHGETLKDWLERSWQPRPTLAAMVVRRLAAALEHAHGLGIIHRDIKPENVMIRDDGRIKLMDFGIAQILDEHRLTMTGQLLGSPAYMAPELIAGRAIDARTDLFALGILLYQLATGSLPFSGRNPHEVLSKIAVGEYAAPASVDCHVDAQLEAIIDRALSREPELRFQNAAELGAALASYLEDHETSPESAEVERYFRSPGSYVEDLDTRICELYIRRGEEAAKAGQSAKALRFLSHALELDPNNERASQVLEAVQRRGRTMRRLVSAGAAASLLGIIAASTALMSSQSSGGDLSQDAATTRMTGHLRPQRDGRPPDRASGDTTKTGTNVQDRAMSTGPESDGGNPFAQFPDFLAARPGDDLGDEAEAALKLDDPALDATPGPGSLNTGSQPRSGPNNVETDDRTTGSSSSRSRTTQADRAPARKSGSARRSAGTRRSSSPGTKPEATTTGERSPKSAATNARRVICRVSVSGLPVSARGHFALSTGRGPAIPVPAARRGVVDIEIADRPTKLSLVAARAGAAAHHHGALQLDPERCRADNRVLTLVAQPNPAQLKFVADNFPLDDLIFQCVRNCNGQFLKPVRGNTSRQFRLRDGSLEETIVLDLRASGYRSKTSAITLSPGINRLTVHLEPLGR